MRSGSGVKAAVEAAQRPRDAGILTIDDRSVDERSVLVNLLSGTWDTKGSHQKTYSWLVNGFVTANVMMESYSILRPKVQSLNSIKFCTVYVDKSIKIKVYNQVLVGYVGRHFRMFLIIVNLDQAFRIKYIIKLHQYSFFFVDGLIIIRLPSCCCPGKLLMNGKHILSPEVMLTSG